MALLEVNKLETHYGEIKAVKGVSFVVQEKEIVTLIGANGAGKSTILNTIAGVVPVHSGEILFNGKDMTQSPTHDRVSDGLVLSPEGRQIFPEFTVEKNLKMGAFIIPKDDRLELQEVVFDLFPVLKTRRKQTAGTLSGGEQQMLAVARALMSKPKLLMLDEPSLGLAPLIVAEIFKLFRRINSMGTTILLVEQNARMALSISNRAYVLETGKIVLEGAGRELADNDKVKEAYLGGHLD